MAKRKTIAELEGIIEMLTRQKNDDHLEIQRLKLALKGSEKIGEEIASIKNKLDDVRSMAGAGMAAFDPHGDAYRPKEDEHHNINPKSAAFRVLELIQNTCNYSGSQFMRMY